MRVNVNAEPDGTAAALGRYLSAAAGGGHGPRRFEARVCGWIALALSALVLSCPLGAAELVARGLSFPFFDDAGRLTHKLIAAGAEQNGDVQQLRDVEIEYYAADAGAAGGRRVVQRVTAAEAMWDQRREVLTGRGSITVETEGNRLTGEGFHFDVATSRVEIERDFMMTNGEVVLTSRRAVIDLVLEGSSDELKVRDVKRCEAFGDLRVKVLPAAKGKYDFDEARSDRAIYVGATHTITIPNETRLVKDGRVSTVNQVDRIELDPESRPATKLK